jgi:hypothetical protein
VDDELSEQGRRLIDAAMVLDVPPEVVVEDSWGMVVSRLTLETSREPAPSVEAPAQARPRRSGTIAITAIVAAVLGGGLWLITRPAATLPPMPHAPTRAPIAAALSPEPPATPAVVPPPAATPAELARLLDDAEATIASDPTRALASVDRHAELAPLLDADRRMALRIEALCAQGRTTDASSEATAFLATARASQWSTRVRASCAGG